MLSMSMVPADAGRQGVEVEIDIKPNSINPASNGIIPVVVFGEESFDASGGFFAPGMEFGPNESAPIHPNGHLQLQ